MATKLYVGNLPYSTTEDDLTQLFSQFGAVLSARLIIDRDNGRSKGYSFVEFEKKEEADAAIAGLNGKDFEGRALVVNEARPMTDRPPRRDGDSRGGGNGGGGDRDGFSSFRKRNW
jgi:RNA recognition motif-containing protein